jgi:hypothetical protein
MSDRIQRIHVHHPALLRIAEVTDAAEHVILDALSSLEEGRLESDVIFPLPCPATIRVTILTGHTYTYRIPIVGAPPPVTVEHLNDIGDVDVPSPADGHVLYWHQPSQLWLAAKGSRVLTTQGDLLIRGATDLERLPKPPSNYFLRMGTDQPQWAKGYEFGHFPRLWQHELSFFDWTTTKTGSAGIEAQGYGSIRIKTGNTPGSQAKGQGYNWGWHEFHDIDIDWWAWLINFNTTTNGQKWLKIDQSSYGDPTSQSIGWRIDGTALKGITHDGTLLHVIDLDTTVNAGDHIRLFMTFLHQNKVEWWVNGQKKAETDQIPTTQAQHDCFPILAITNGPDSADNSIQLCAHDWIKGN